MFYGNAPPGLAGSRAGSGGGEGAVLDAPNRADKEEQDPSLGHPVRSCSKWKEEADGPRNSRPGGTTLLPLRNFVCRGRRTRVDEVETRMSEAAQNNLGEVGIKSKIQ